MNFDRHVRYWNILRRPRFASATTLLGAFILTGCAAVPPNSQGLGSWLDRMDQASEKTKTDRLLKEAQAGNAKSMYYLGYAYSKGKGIERDDAKAVECYHRAVKGGFLWPAFRLAIAYRDGRGVKKNQKIAAAWARKAATEKDRRGEYLLGRFYGRCFGVPKDHLAAVQWYRRAAAQESSSAIARLALAYYTGRGVTKNYKQYVEWAQRSAELKMPGANTFSAMLTRPAAMS